MFRVFGGVLRVFRVLWGVPGSLGVFRFFRGCSGFLGGVSVFLGVPECSVMFRCSVFCVPVFLQVLHGKKQSQPRVHSYSENCDLGLENAVRGRKRRSQVLLCGTRSRQITAF